MKFRKRPVVVEAVQFCVTPIFRSAEIVAHFGDFKDWRGGSHNGSPCLFIQTLEGEIRVDNGDWIIKGVKGEYYPCKPDIFAATYEPVKEPANEP